MHILVLDIHVQAPLLYFGPYETEEAASHAGTYVEALDWEVAPLACLPKEAYLIPPFVNGSMIADERYLLVDMRPLLLGLHVHGPYNGEADALDDFLRHRCSFPSFLLHGRHPLHGKIVCLDDLSRIPDLDTPDCFGIERPLRDIRS